MYFVEVVKKLKVAVAMVALSAMFPQFGVVHAESPAVAVISKETLEARLAKLVHEGAEMEALELQFKAWSESTKPKEGEEPSEAHKKINADLAEVQKQIGNLNNVISFLNRKIKNNMSSGELAIADSYLSKVEVALENLELPTLPAGTPDKPITPVVVGKVETTVLPAIDTSGTVEDKVEVTAEGGEDKVVVTADEGVEKDKTVVEPVVVVEEDEAARRARIAADVAARLKLMQEKDDGIAPVDASKMYTGKREEVVAAPIVAEEAGDKRGEELVLTTAVVPDDKREETVVIPAADDKRVETVVIPVADDKRVETVVIPAADEVIVDDFTTVVTQPRRDGSEEVIAKDNLGKGYDETKVQYVELNCEGALVVKREPNGASSTFDDIACKNERNRPTKVLVLGFEDGHFKVFVNGFTGWISAVKTSDAKEVGEVDEEDTTIVIKPQDGTLNCDSRLMHRTGPTTEYRILQKIPCKSGGRPTPVKIIGKHNQTGWYLVSHNGTIAWSSNRYINASEPNNLQIVTNDLLQGLSDVPDLGNLGIKCDPNGNQNDDPNCMRFQADFYTKRDSAKQMAAAINRAKQRGTNAKKAQFFELFAPIAVYLQTKTGWPASVTLAQMAIETNWGTSNVFRSLNNFGGHSCTSYSANGSRKLRNRNLIEAANEPGLGLAGLYKANNGSSRIRTPCTYPRPRREGHYYREFPSVADASMLYADNVLESGYYPAAANHVKESFAAGRKANPETVVSGLRAYAKASSYRTDLMRIIRSNDLKRFDNIKSCPLSTRN